jgi:signal transduction histidine kinase
LIENALLMHRGALARHQVEVVCDFEKVPSITVDKHKVLQILINLIGNAKYAMDETEAAQKLLRVRLECLGENGIAISVSDNGVGIPSENLSRIFQHGFTTKKDGHGFGLHSSAIAARELGGSLIALSDGEGLGATFVLELPIEITAEMNLCKS